MVIFISYDHTRIEDEPPSQYCHLSNQSPGQYLPMSELELGQSEAKMSRSPAN